MRIDLRVRLYALSFYFGLSPLFFRSQTLRKDAWLRHQYRVANAVILLLLLLMICCTAILLFLSFSLIAHRDWYEGTNVEGWVLDIMRKSFLCWAVLWVYGLLLALAGSDRELPIAALFTKKPVFARISSSMQAVLFALALLVVPVAAHASSLMREDDAKAKVFLVYEDNGTFPRWIFALGFYRMSLTAREHMGTGTVVALRVSEQAIQRALSEGEFVFIGSHGSARGLQLPEKQWLTPADIPQGSVNPALQFVYLTGCDSGAERESWEAALRPAKVITHRRLTAVVEHAWWLWFTGPKILRSLPK